MAFHTTPIVSSAASSDIRPIVRPEYSHLLASCKRSVGLDIPLPRGRSSIWSANRATRLPEAAIAWVQLDLLTWRLLLRVRVLHLNMIGVRTAM